MSESDVAGSVSTEPENGFMDLALAEARVALGAGEVPVGAVVVRNGQVIGRGHNSPVHDHDPTGHAEIAALREAARNLGNYRLDDCDVYVTLEPCAMCAGAMLHARVRRVIFGASDPKTGAAGSVLDLFGIDSLNHQTTVASGVREEECGQMLRSFFQSRRMEQKKVRQPLREDAVRTPEKCFETLPGYPWQPHYVSDLEGLDGLRMHYLDEGPEDAPRTWLCLHGNPAWSYLYRKMIPPLLAAGHRVVAPDLIGFGKSDKPKRADFHRFDWHRRVLLALVERLELNHVVLVVQDWGGLLGLTLPMAAEERYEGLLVMNTLLATGDFEAPAGFLAWREMCARKPGFSVSGLLGRACPLLSEGERLAYDAPFVDPGYRAALRAFPELVPLEPADAGTAISRETAEFWTSRWSGQSLMVVGAKDPVLGPEVMRRLHSHIRGCPDPVIIPEAGHFVPEWGEQVASLALGHFTPRI